MQSRLDSQYFQTLTDLLKHIESLGAPVDQYGVTDGGQTLETSKKIHDQIKETAEFKAFCEVGGNHYSFDDFDDDSWIFGSKEQLDEIDSTLGIN